jgi:ADP-ribose pyrophosphatase YjhB (NUDIX family)
MRTLVVRGLQKYWRLTRGLTMGAQGLVLDQANRVLLVRHGYRPGWHFPGGGVEKGEAATVAVTRELDEEAGIEPISEPELYGIYTNFVKFPSDHVVLFLIREWRQTRVPLPNREILEQGFFAPDGLPEGAAEAVKRRLGEVLEGRPRVSHW